MPSHQIHYWRDKRGHEIDFVFVQRRRTTSAIECKWSADEFNPANFHAFARQYPQGEFFVVTHDVERSFRRKYGDLSVQFVNGVELVEHLEKVAAEHHNFE